MVLPLVAGLLIAVVAVGLVVTMAIATQNLAASLARGAAVQHDADVTAGLNPDVGVLIDPPSGRRVRGDIVTVVVSRPVRLPIPGGPVLTVTGAASALTEAIP